jgi:hypothetical protein
MPDPTWTVTIDAPPEKVWPWVADLSKHAEWSPKPYRVEWLSGEWRNRYELSPEGSGTRVTKTMVGPPPTGIGKVVFPIVSMLLIRPGVQKGLDLLKTKVEASG